MPGPARVLSPMTALKHQKRALRRAISKERAKARKLANARECVHHLRVALDQAIADTNREEALTFPHRALAHLDAE